MARAQGRKRAPHGEPMVYVQRRDANGNPTLWAGKVELPRDAKGKRRHRYVYGATEKVAAKKFIKLKEQLRMHGDLSTADTPLGKYLDSWLRDVKEHVKPNTWRSYRTEVEQHIKPAIGKIRMGQLSAAHVRQMHTYLRTPREGKKPLSSTTRHNAHRVLSIALNAALRDGGIVTHNAAHDERAPRKAANTRTGLDLPAAVKVLELVLKGTVPLASRWQVALVLGLRQGERLGLRWSHVDLDTGIADLAWAQQRISYSHGCNPGGDPTCGRKQGRSCPSRYLHIPDGMEHIPLEGNIGLMRPKTEGSQRVVALIEPLVEALRQRRAEVEAERPGYKIDHDLIWCTPTGGPIDARDDWADWHALLAAAGAPKVTLHEARHTVATLLLEADVDPAVIKSLLGHSSIVTSRGYMHISVALQRKALEGLGQRLQLTR